MLSRQPCRVQWVTRANQMAHMVERVTRSGGNLVAKSSYDVSTEDLDLIEDRDTGRLSIAEFMVEPKELARQVVAASNQLGPTDTLLIDLTGTRPKIQVLPVNGEHGVIVRAGDGLRRFPRSTAGLGRYNTRWLSRRLSERGLA